MIELNAKFQPELAVQQIGMPHQSSSSQYMISFF